MFSTASDMFAFHQMMLNGGIYNGVRILSRASVEAMTSLQTAELVTMGTMDGPFGVDGAGWGLGWTVIRKPVGLAALYSVGTFSHGGDRGTVGWVDPKRDVVCLFMMQRTPAQMEELSLFLTLAAGAILD